MQQTRRVFRPEPDQVGAARLFVRDELAAGSVDADDALLLVSELATNAVLHARSDFTVAVALLPERVRVEVSDGNSRLPTVVSVPADAYSGRGLLLLQALSVAWGVESHAAEGKTIWFEVPTTT